MSSRQGPAQREEVHQLWQKLALHLPIQQSCRVQESNPAAGAADVDTRSVWLRDCSKILRFSPWDVHPGTKIALSVCRGRRFDPSQAQLGSSEEMHHAGKKQTWLGLHEH